MSCEECAELLGDAVDASLSPSAKTALDEHLAQCDACRALLADLVEIRSTASALDRRIPSQEVWTRIEAGTMERRRSWLPLAAAAALTIAVLGGAWLTFSTRNRPQPAPDEAAALATSAEAEIQQAEEHYAKAISALEQLTANRQNTLDPQVNEAIAQSLRTIDRAIADSRDALKADPGSEVAQASLLEALRTKVALLRETVSLMNPRS